MITNKTRNRERRTRKQKQYPDGAPLGIHDKNGAALCVGDFIRLHSPMSGHRYGRLSGDIKRRTVTLDLPRWESKNIPLDDGMKQHITKLTAVEAEAQRCKWYWYYYERA